MAKKPPSPKSVEALTHESDKRKNIPSAEQQSIVQKEHEQPRQVKYPRNTDLDPQLVWRGKDQQDWSDLVVNAPPLYIQEKVHPKALIDDFYVNRRKPHRRRSSTCSTTSTASLKMPTRPSSISMIRIGRTA